MEDTDRYGSHRAAAYVGEKPKTWTSYVSRRQAPQPDGYDQGLGRNYWLKATLDAWLKNRPGQGARTDLTQTPGTQ